MSTEISSWKSTLKSKLSVKPPVNSDPRFLKRTTKGIILLCLALCASTAGFSSTIYFPGKILNIMSLQITILIAVKLLGLPDITADLNAPPIATTLTAALFVLAMGIAPVFWASLSDFYQVRRILLICSMFIFAIASLGSAFINNIWGLVVLRCVQSVGSSCGQSVGAGKCDTGIYMLIFKVTHKLLLFFPCFIILKKKRRHCCKIYRD